MILTGTLVNALAIVILGTIGSMLKNGISTRYTDLIMNALGLFVVVMGIMYTIKTQQMLVIIFSLVIGSALGEWINIEKKLDNLGNYLQNKLKFGNGNFSQGFVMASLIFCIGSMAILGALQSGLYNKHDILFTKASIDGVAAFIFASTMGIGVAFAALPILVYQGGLTLLAGTVAPYLSQAVITEMTATGGILIMGIGLSLLEIKKIKIGNMLPSIFLPIIFMMFVK